MPLNKLDNFLKNVEGRILYVSPSDLDASDAMSNQGNSQTTPFKTIQRALIEAARFSYVPGNNNDITEKTTILLMPGEHVVDNRPGFKIKEDGGNPKIYSPTTNGVEADLNKIALNLESQFDLNVEDNILYKFNSVNGGVIVPRGTSIVGLDLRKTKIRPKYVPNPTDDSVPNSAIFRITGACYFWQFSLFDGKLSEKVYVKNNEFSGENLVKPSFSHHKLTCFEYADGVNKDTFTDLTDLNMYYYKLSIAYGSATEDRNISEKFPDSTEGFVSKRPEFEIVGAFAADPIRLSSIESGSGGVATRTITVTTLTDHGLDVGTPIRVKGVDDFNYNVSTFVSSIDTSDPKKFTYVLERFNLDIITSPNVGNAQIIVETDTVNGASPYIFNISLRSVFGMNGMHADGSKATGFRSMVVAQFTGVSLQKDDRAFVKYDKVSRLYDSLPITTVSGGALADGSSASDSSKIYHLDSEAIYRNGWETRHVKISNNSILQIVSVFAIGYGIHFEAQSGADASITNSNSNFGQLALVSDGFRKNAFEKDDRAFITHVIPPRAITTKEEEIDWLALDQSNETASKLFLFGFTSKDIKPPSITQGFRIGAKSGDKLFVKIGGVEKEARIVMNGTDISGVKESSVNDVDSDTSVFTTSAAHSFDTGEKVIVISDDGDLPENLEEKTVYFIVKESNTTFKLASSKTNALNGEFIKVYGGANLKVLSRVTDKNSGDIGHPVQFDETELQWYINVSSNGNTISGELTGTERTEPSYVKRKSDIRTLDERIYKFRLVIPKEIDNAKNPENGFIIQESQSTDVTQVSDFTSTNTLTREDFLFNRNPRFISSCTFDDSPKTVTITTEKPHDLTVGDLITVKNIKDSTNTTGLADKGYNGEFTVTSVPSSMKFTYSTGNVTIGASGTNDFNDKTSTGLKYPRFERTDLKSNVYIFRNDMISEYINDIQDGIYQVFALNSSNSIPTEYTGLNYSQNVVDVYPQLDRDNIDENPPAAKSFAVRTPLGQVVTNDSLKSITRETSDKLLQKIGVGQEILSFTDSGTSGIVSFTREHNIGGLLNPVLSNNSGFTEGTYFNVKVFTDPNTQNDTKWNGTLAEVVVNSSGVITNFEITNAGSGWTTNNKGYFDSSVIGATGTLGDASGNNLTSAQIGQSSDLVLQVTGDGTTSDGYFKITGVNSKKRVSIAKTSGDVNPVAGQYGFVVSPSVTIDGSGNTFSDGVKTIVTTTPHGFVSGNRFQLNDSSNNNKGTFIVKTKVGVTSFNFETSTDFSVDSGTVLKHGLSANDGVSEKGDENLSARGVELFNNESSKLDTAMDNVGTAVTVSTSTSSIIVGKKSGRFPYGSYLLIDEEIMRVASPTLTGGSNNEITVIRGVFGTLSSDHLSGSLIKSIKPFPIQFNRPSILRASGHTFEYLGYGPGNYSTALPQVQVKTISEKEEFLSQSQERAGGAVVYTGMNNKGDFYIGNQKKSALTGEETSFDTPIPSIAGEDPARLSVVFDEVTVKERLVVEGGDSSTSLSEFDGPVTFNNEVQVKGVDGILKIKSDIDSTSSSTGSLVISGGVGIAKTVNLPDDASINFGNDGDLKIFHDSNDSFIEDTRTGSLKLKGSAVELIHGSSGILTTTSTGAIVSGILTATSFKGDGSALTGVEASLLKDSGNTTRVEATTTGALITGIATATTGSFGNLKLNTETVETTTGNLILKAPSEQDVNVVIDTTTVATFTIEDGAPLIKTDGDISGFFSSSSDRNLKNNIVPISNALDKINAISGYTFSWKKDGKQDTGVIAQEIEALGLPGITMKREDGTLSVKYDQLIPILIEAIKDLTKKVDSLENK